MRRVLGFLGAASALAFLALGAAWLFWSIDDPSLLGFSELPEPPAARAEPRDPLRHVFWGDLHIHTGLSYDAFTLGVRATPDDAYAFAKGRPIRHALGYTIQLSRPLDFAAVTDHAEHLGLAPVLAPDDGPMLRERFFSGNPLRITAYYLQTTLGRMASKEMRDTMFDDPRGPEISADAWREIVASAERHLEPGRFTTFVGYEWSSMPNDQNLHRNVIYRGTQVPTLPFSSLDSGNPEDLWRELDDQRAHGMDSIAIPHNANVSDGRMYERTRFDGSPITAAWAEQRLRNEPVSEILQVKGASETHPLLSSEDEFAGFEILDQKLSASGDASEPRGSYARDALKTGLVLSRSAGLDPYRFGFIGSSDGHNASSPVEEDRYHGKLPLLDGSAGVRLSRTLLLPPAQNRGGRWSSMGLAGVWAEENSRDALFEALRRKETYATSGPRIVVRFFGGFDLPEDLAERPAGIARADAMGVPMGGSLTAPSDGRPPRFLVVAGKDPAGANLDRIQIVKGWLDDAGDAQERVFDVTASDGRVPDPATHRVTALPSTVDAESARYTNRVGASQLHVVWTDPDFAPGNPAFYYARVLEIATPRWSTYDAARLGIAPPEPVAIQERAITSAIWVD